MLVLTTPIVWMWQAYAAQWDMTRFEYEPGTGRLMRKVYADGKAISYSYHCGNLPKRITLASGKWMERFYDGRLNVTSNVYSSENTPDEECTFKFIEMLNELVVRRVNKDRK